MSLLFFIAEKEKELVAQKLDPVAEKNELRELYTLAKGYYFVTGISDKFKNAVIIILLYIS